MVVVHAASPGGQRVSLGVDTWEGRCALGPNATSGLCGDWYDILSSRYLKTWAAATLVEPAIISSLATTLAF